MSDSRDQIRVDQAGLGSILRQYTVIVPPNQREYVCTKVEARQLFRDFSRAISEGGSYFLGTIVSIPRSNSRLEVIDGQQRLATTAIFLAAIRDHLRSKHEDILVRALDNEFLTVIDRTKRVTLPRMSLNVADNQFFAAIIEGNRPKPLHASHTRLLAAADEARAHVRSIVSPLDDRDHGDALNRWVSFIQHDALVILLEVSESFDVFRMFETLNDRGIKTNQADLIKNYLFGRAADRLNEVQVSWARMRNSLETIDEDDALTVDFIRHSLIVLRGFLREAGVYEVVQNEIVKSPQTAVGFAGDLENLAQSYAAVSNPEHTKWNEYPERVRKAIVVFNLLDIKPMRPLLLAITEMMNPKEAGASFQFLLSLGVRLLIASTTRSESIERPLAKAAHEIYQSKITTEAKLRAELDGITPADREFREAFKIARVSNARFARYYLRSLELTAKDEAEPWYMPMDDPEFINLDHVLPQKPMGNWPTFTAEEVRLYANRLGNLALMRTSSNSRSRSDAFADKKAAYEGPYVLTSQIAELEEWTPEAIGKRQEQLAELAVKTWPVPKVRRS